MEQHLKWVGTIAFSLVATVAADTSSAQAQETTLRMSHFVNEQDIRYPQVQDFANKVEEYTEGRVKVKIFPGNSLHPFDKAIDAVLGGVADIAPMNSSAVDSRLPCTNIAHIMPAGVDTSKLVEFDAELRDLLLPEFEKIGLVPVHMTNSTYDQEWWFRQPYDPDMRFDNALEGKLVRTVAPAYTHIIETFGGKPVQVSPKEVFQSADRGVVDIIIMSVTTFSSWNLWDVMPHFVRAGLSSGVNFDSINKEIFDKLSTADQEAILRAGAEAEKAGRKPLEDYVDQKVGNAVMTKQGSAFAIPNDERQRLLSLVVPAWADKLEDACGPELAGKIRSLYEKYKG